MSEPTIEEMIDDVIIDAFDFGDTESGHKLDTSRSALLSRIEELEAMTNRGSFDRFLVKQIRDSKVAEEYAKAVIRDNAFLKIIESQKKTIASIQKEADEWHKMADKLHPRIAHEPDCRSNIDGIFHCNCGADDVDDEFCAITQRYSHEKEGEGNE